MTTSRLFFLANTFPRFYPTLLSKGPLLRPPLPFHPPRFGALRPVRSVSAAVDSVFDAIPGLDLKLRDPWPEWASFVGKLKDKGYFEEDVPGAKDDGYGGPEVNLLKTACLRFARERFDIITFCFPHRSPSLLSHTYLYCQWRSLSKDEIEAVVGSGCPNLLRNVVKSSKRLRSYVKLDEGEACNFMNFARKIECLKCKEDGPKKIDFSNLKMLEGDLTCPQFRFMNFPRNTKCRRCQESRPKGLLQSGEWCDFVNFRRNLSCLKCSCGRPEGDDDQYEDNMWRRLNSLKRLENVDSGNRDTIST